MTIKKDLDLIENRIVKTTIGNFELFGLEKKCLIYKFYHLIKIPKSLIIFKDDKRSHVSIWKWIQRFGSLQIYKRKRVSAFIII